MSACEEFFTKVRNRDGIGESDVQDSGKVDIAVMKYIVQNALHGDVDSFRKWFCSRFGQSWNEHTPESNGNRSEFMALMLLLAIALLIMHDNGLDEKIELIPFFKLLQVIHEIPGTENYGNCLHHLKTILFAVSFNDVRNSLDVVHSLSIFSNIFSSSVMMLRTSTPLMLRTSTPFVSQAYMTLFASRDFIYCFRRG